MVNELVIVPLGSSLLGPENRAAVVLNFASLRNPFFLFLETLLMNSLRGVAVLALFVLIFSGSPVRGQSAACTPADHHSGFVRDKGT